MGGGGQKKDRNEIKREVRKLTMIRMREATEVRRGKKSRSRGGKGERRGDERGAIKL